ncbi:hypothetical protein PIB30_042607 [Stylosanthes scabra]|uniref:Uncharacterized protein n=1 Tax=Stylosanthes scabra TaxID=79078 RepID=A0ABU6WDC4_9FABA|nr:hypothetical protein [Stylosanthes scabra]
MCVEDSKRVKFWKDVWFGKERLEDKFSRLFSNSLQKEVVINDCGLWSGSKWVDPGKIEEWVETWKALESRVTKTQEEKVVNVFLCYNPDYLEM